MGKALWTHPSRRPNLGSGCRTRQRARSLTVPKQALDESLLALWAAMEGGVMAGFTYKFRVDGLRITNTRAFHEDTDVVTVGLVGSDGKPLVSPEISDMGDLNNGTWVVNSKLSPVFDGLLQGASFYYMVVNSGYDRSNEADAKTATNALSDVGAAVAAAFTPGASWAALWAGLDELTKEVFNKMIFADCDGAVAADAIKLDQATLAAWTSGFGMHAETRPYAGSPSPDGCGSNSFYYVSWSVIRVGSQADQPPPPADSTGDPGQRPPVHKGPVRVIGPDE